MNLPKNNRNWINDANLKCFTMSYIARNHCLLGHLSTGFEENILISIIALVIDASQMMFCVRQTVITKALFWNYFQPIPKSCILKLNFFFSNDNCNVN